MQRRENLAGNRPAIVANRRDRRVDNRVDDRFSPRLVRRGLPGRSASKIIDTGNECALSRKQVL